MMRTWGWYITRFAVILLMVAGIRLALGYAAVSWVESHLASVDLPVGATDGSVPIPGLDGIAGDAPPGDPGRADQPIQEDLVEDGQVVRRDGKLVVLIDASDPENEVYVPLDAEEVAALEPPWLLRDGWGPTVGAVVGGLGLYWMLWSIGALLFKLDRPEDGASSAS